MIDYIKRQDEIAEARQDVEERFGRRSKEVQLFIQQSRFSAEDLVPVQKDFSMGLDGVIAEIKQHAPAFDINVFNQ